MRCQKINILPSCCLIWMLIGHLSVSILIRILNALFSLSVQAPGDEDHATKDFFRYHGSKARSKTYINMREVSERFTLPPGEYLLVPTTFKPHEEADFLVRIFSEKKAGALWVFSSCSIWDKLRQQTEPKGVQNETMLNVSIFSPIMSSSLPQGDGHHRWCWPPRRK